MKYLSTKTYKYVEIDLETAELPALLDAYNSLFAMSDDGGAFPGSKQWKAAKPFADQLSELVAARPEIEAYRNKIAAEKRAARLAGLDIGGI